MRRTHFGGWILLVFMGGLLVAGCDGSEASKNSTSAFLLSARSGEIEKLKKEIAKGADVDQRSTAGWTALMFAAWQGHEEAVSLLLDAGGDPNLVSLRVAGNTQAPLPETTALAQALENGHLSIARLLLDRGAKADPVSVAIAGGLTDLSFLQEMAAEGAELSNHYGNLYNSSAMRVACRNGRLKNVEWLIEQGVQPDLGDLKTAVGHNHPELVEFLVMHATGEELFSPQDLSDAFIFAATKRTGVSEQEKNLWIVRFLLSNGADRQFRPESGQVKGQTALEFLEKKRVQATELIRLNRYGEAQQTSDREWLNHINATMQLIQSSHPDETER